MALKFSCETVIPASPSRVYQAWLDGEEHGEMTGADAEGSPVVGAHFQAWGGYISGRNLELVEGERIVQAWRTSEFADGDPDSLLEIVFESHEHGTRLILEHSNLPEHGMQYLKGWTDHYFTPMLEHFSREF